MPNRDTLYAEAQTLIAATPERVWTLLTSIDRWPEWNTQVKAARLQGPLQPGTDFHWKSGGIWIRSTLREIRYPSRLSWTGRTFGIRAWHEWELTATAGGVLLRTAESFDGWLPRLMPVTMQRTLDEALPAWLQAIRAAAETAAA